MSENEKLKFEIKSFEEFLTSTPQGPMYEISDFCLLVNGYHIPNNYPIKLFCKNEACEGIRFFDPVDGHYSLDLGELNDRFLIYQCRNCNLERKTYAIRYLVFPAKQDIAEQSLVLKIGEVPLYGFQTPARLIALIGPDKEYFLQGRKAEIAGLGIGAFAYYRRVIENQKFRLINEVSKVAKRLGANEDVLGKFHKAANETQFSRAIDDVNDVIPQALLIKGQNPLRLLHSALSEGIHAQSDTECLDIATSIRVVLIELSDRISLALRDHAELEKAVNRLLQPPNKKLAQSEDFN